MEAASKAFLADMRPRPWKPGGGIKLREPQLFVGKGANAVEVVAGIASRKPKRAELETCWKARHGGRASPVVLVVFYDDKTIITPPLAYHHMPLSI